MVFARDRVLPGTFMVMLVPGHRLRRSGRWLGFAAVTRTADVTRSQQLRDQEQRGENANDWATGHDGV
jgi:hypothetical protein